MAWRGKSSRCAYILTYGNGTAGRLGIHSRALSAQVCIVIHEQGRTHAGTTRTLPDTARSYHWKHHLQSRVRVSVMSRPSKAPLHAFLGNSWLQPCDFAEGGQYYSVSVKLAAGSQPCVRQGPTQDRGTSMRLFSCSSQHV